MTVVLDNIPQQSPPSMSFVQYHVISLDTYGPPMGQGQSGDPGIQSLYKLWNELDEPLMKGTGFFNLGEPGGCDWMLCTGERNAPKFVESLPRRYTFVHEWDGQADTMTFSARKNVTKSIDLSATSTGTIDAPQWHLTINPCGGSTAKTCGAWHKPPAQRGGPVGVLYVSAHLELFATCGDGRCAVQESCSQCPDDCGPCAGAGGTGASTAGSGGAGGGSAGSGAGGVASGGTPNAGASPGGASSGGASTGGQSGGAPNGGAAGDGMTSGGASATSPSDLDLSGGTESEPGCGCAVPRRSASTRWGWAALFGALANARRRERR